MAKVKQRLASKSRASKTSSRKEKSTARNPAKKTNSRAKGACGERELANYLVAQGYDARRGQQFAGGTDSPDVVCAGLADLHLECKRTEQGSKALYAWLAQAVRDCGAKKPVVVHRQNGQPWVAILRLEDLLDLVLLTGI